MDTPTPRDWPVLRDLVVRADATRQCADLAMAVAEAPRPAEAWRERMAGMCGAGRLMLIARDSHDRPYAFVAAYSDGEHADRVVIVRHLLVLPTPAAADATTRLLLDRVQEWAEQQRAHEVLLEVAAGDAEMAGILREQGYETTGRPLPAVDALNEVAGEGSWASPLRRRSNGAGPSSVGLARRCSRSPPDAPSAKVGRLGALIERLDQYRGAGVRRSARAVASELATRSPLP